jgi:O-Antigen ligase
MSAAAPAPAPAAAPAIRGRAAVAAGAAVLLLAGPTLIAFDAGGYFDEARLTGAIVAWALVAVAAAVSGQPLPRSTAGRVALAGAAGLTAWTMLSLLWAPLATPAQDDVQRLLLYLGALIASAALLRGPGLPGAVEPALALGILVVIGYGLSERIVPGLVDLGASRTAAGRLEQPLTYWNAMGALAAIGVVMCARLAGDLARPAALNAAAAAAAVPLSVGLYLSFSRGALAAALAGLLVLALAAPRRGPLAGIAIVAAAGAAAAVAAALLPGVRALEGSLASREGQGLAMLAVLAVLMAAAAAAAVLGARRLGAARGTAVGRRWLVAAAAVLALGAVAAVAVASTEPGKQPAVGAQSARLASVESNRYKYWKVALEAAAANPLAGTGAGGFRVEWRRERPVADPAVDAHSLELETAAELGLVGLALLAAAAGGIAFSAGSALRRGAAVEGWIAALAVLVVHASLDWDWEMPAVALVGVLLSGALIAAADPPEAGDGR